MPIITVKSCLNCGIPHEWMFEGADLQELRLIKTLTGMRAAEFADAGETGDPDAIAALLYILHRRDRITVPFDDINLDFRDFEMKATDEEEKEMAALAERMKTAADNALSPKILPPANGPKRKAG